MSLSIRKRGKVWHVRGTVRVGKEVRDVQEYSTGCRERAAAEEYRGQREAEIRAEMLAGPAGRARGLTIGDALLEYVNRPGGLHRMDVWRVGELNDVLGDFAINDALAGWSRFKQQRCAGLAPATVDRFRATLQAALNHAGRERGFQAPAIPHVRFNNIRVRWLTKPQQEILLRAYAEHVQPIALTLCFQGCRTQEALQLSWPDLDLARGTVWFGRTKSGVPRMLELHPRVHEAIGRLWLARGEPVAGHVFSSALGRPYPDTREYKLPGGNPLRRAHATACRRAGVGNFTVHDWRHSWASALVMAGVDLPTIARMGGWRSLRMVERYATVSTEHMAEAIRKLA
jgi:integrase